MKVLLKRYEAPRTDLQFYDYSDVIIVSGDDYTGDPKDHGNLLEIAWDSN